MIVIWNAPFDRPRVEKALGISIPRENVVDTMDIFHVLYNAFKRKLGFATSLMPSSRRIKMWKHLSQIDPAYYSCADALTLLRNHYDTQRLVDETGVRPCVEVLHTKLDPALDFMSRAGMLVDRAKRNELSTKLHLNLEEIIVEMNRVVPESVRSPKVWKSLSGATKGQATLVKNAKKNGEPFERLEAAELFVIPATAKDTQCAACGAIGVKADHTSRKFLKSPPVVDLFGEVPPKKARKRKEKAA